MEENRLPYRKDGGFKVPEGYFQEFEDRMMARLNLAEVPVHEKPFKVPEQYFEQLSDRIIDRLESEPETGKIIPLFNRRMLSYVASVAAVVAILFSSIVLNRSGELGFDDLNMSAIENYLLESLDFDNPNNTPVEEYAVTTPANPNIDKQALLEYLNDNIEEPALLLNED